VKRRYPKKLFFIFGKFLAVAGCPSKLKLSKIKKKKKWEYSPLLEFAFIM